jgi:hypothetical protein
VADRCGRVAIGAFVHGIGPVSAEHVSGLVETSSDHPIE